jgi:hypothetical protein
MIKMHFTPQGKLASLAGGEFAAPLTVKFGI